MKIHKTFYSILMDLASDTFDTSTTLFTSFSFNYNHALFQCGELP